MRSLVAEKRLRYVPAPDARYHPSMSPNASITGGGPRRASIHPARLGLVAVSGRLLRGLPSRAPADGGDRHDDGAHANSPAERADDFGVPALATFASRAGVRRAITLMPPVDVVANAPMLSMAATFGKAGASARRRFFS